MELELKELKYGHFFFLQVECQDLYTLDQWDGSGVAAG